MFIPLRYPFIQFNELVYRTFNKQHLMIIKYFLCGNLTLVMDSPDDSTRLQKLSRNWRRSLHCNTGFVPRSN